MKRTILASFACAAIGMTLAAPAAAETIEEKAAKRMRAMDANRDGMVTLEEFTAHRAEWTSRGEDAKKMMEPDRVKRAFDRNDTNGDGFITLDEMVIREQNNAQ